MGPDKLAQDEPPHLDLCYLQLSHVAQSVGHLTCKSEVLGSIPGLARPLIQEGQLSVTGESMCTKYWLTT